MRQANELGLLWQGGTGLQKKESYLRENDVRDVWRDLC